MKPFMARRLLLILFRVCLLTILAVGMGLWLAR